MIDPRNEEAHDERTASALAQDTLDNLLAQALDTSDPVGWVRRRVQIALRRLEQTDHPTSVKDEAKRQLFSLERRLVQAVRTNDRSA
jgi:hypothetical protein